MNQYIISLYATKQTNYSIYKKIIKQISIQIKYYAMTYR